MSAEASLSAVLQRRLAQKQDPSEEYQRTITLDMSPWITISNTREANASEI
jgi:hypothetical protein